MVPGKMLYLIQRAFSNWQDVCSPMSQADNINIFGEMFLKKFLLCSLMRYQTLKTQTLPEAFFCFCRKANRITHVLR